jgi:ribosomal protein S18 acetylase RimI-like enzyme
MIVRPAKAEDMDALLSIEQSCFRKERFYQQYIESLLSSPEVDSLVGEVKGTVVASSMIIHDRKSKRSHLLSLATLPSHQGRGYSKLMLARVEELARERGSSIIFLEVRVDNSPALRLYQGNGYIATWMLPDFFGPQEDAWLMEKAL